MLFTTNPLSLERDHAALHTRTRALTTLEVDWFRDAPVAKGVHHVDGLPVAHHAALAWGQGCMREEQDITMYSKVVDG